MRLSKQQTSKKGPTLAALTIAGAGASAVALKKRERILGAIGRGGEVEGEASGASEAPGASSDGESQPVTRLPKPGIG